MLSHAHPLHVKATQTHRDGNRATTRPGPATSRRMLFFSGSGRERQPCEGGATRRFRAFTT
eukprot:8731396-Alexandrium_andersonii.AAC.1